MEKTENYHHYHKPVWFHSTWKQPHSLSLSDFTELEKTAKTDLHEEKPGASESKCIMLGLLLRCLGTEPGTTEGLPWTQSGRERKDRLPMVQIPRTTWQAGVFSMSSHPSAAVG